MLYWYRSPPDVKVGREPFDLDVRRALEVQNPDVIFDWRAIVETPIPSADADKWRERRRAERAAKHAAAQEESAETETEAEVPSAEADAEASAVTAAVVVSPGAEPQSAVAPAGGDANRKRRRRRRGGRGGDGSGSHRAAGSLRPRNIRRLRAIESRSLKRVRAGSAIVAVTAVLWWTGRSLAPSVLGVLTHLQSLGAAAPIAFMVVYACAVVALIPGSLMTIAGGAVFGIVPRR